MGSLEINSVFYSNTNLDLAYNLKLLAREEGITVNYAFSVPELAKQLNENIVSVVFIDTKTVKLNANFLQFIKSYPSSKNPLIICIKSFDNDDNSELNDLEVDYYICPKKLSSEIKAIKPQLNHYHYLKVARRYDFSKINIFLSEYLISVGISSKHAGFSFIKQCIEYFLNNNGIVRSLNTHVYPYIAEKNKTQAHNIERNIRNSIKYACKTNTKLKEDVSYLFRNNTISNRAFLCYLLDMVLNKFSYKSL